ncbi:hypothetical protein [Lacisediminihabitans profunda]|uniref:Uncharacterized protein n=1 Tax=Lacisediminihabitans profunda TaxID=2594790 RepID=A0A5C8UPH7_9MICO|nr:hypothetical protein [Lacisediminihabitans profunda]TXN29427.1 hypothetical protein FVP33_14755 [Lacisediminihabitans profunda]
MRHHDAAGGYLDIKVVSERYLDEAAEHAEHPTRASLDGARIVWSRVADRTLANEWAFGRNPPGQYA